MRHHCSDNHPSSDMCGFSELEDELEITRKTQQDQTLGGYMGLLEILRSISPDSLRPASVDELAELSAHCERTQLSVKEAMSRLSDERQEGTVCCVCRDRPKSVVLLPCKHLCLCEPCAGTGGRRIARCPMCRQHISDMLHVFS
jgi:hypothetical protein